MIEDLEPTEDNLIDTYKNAASGAQRLAEAIDILLPALIEISLASAKTATVKNLRDLAESALLNFEEQRGQKLDRRRYMASVNLTESVAAGAALHAARNG